MKKFLLSACILLSCMVSVSADDVTIDISGNNTSSSYVSYSQAISLPSTRTVNVMMARYAYFSSTISGTGTLNLHAGGERCYLGTAKGASWPNWSNFKGDVHVYPYRENSSSAGFYGVVMAHGGKAFSAEDIEGGIKSGKVNNSMENNHVVLHDGSTLCCEAHTSGSGFRLGELQAEAGSIIQGYMKKGTRPAYFMVGCLGTDATLAGTIAPPDYSDTHLVGIIKEGKGTYRITGNRNYISGALRVLEGRVLVMNDRQEAEQKKLRGATGAKSNNQEAIVYVFNQGLLGGTGSIGGTVDNYGTIEPGADGIGTLTLKNYAVAKEAHLYVRPSSVLRFKIGSTNDYDRLAVDGMVKYNHIGQDFVESDEMPIFQLALNEDADVKVGDEFCLLTAKGKASQDGEWLFRLQKPGKYTWALEEHEEEGMYRVVARLVSLKDDDTPDDPNPHDNPDDGTQMGAFYDDGIDDNADATSLRTYARKNGKLIGTAISTWKTDITNENLAITKEIGKQFSLLVAENEMKFDALEPSRGQFNYSGADNLVNFARRNLMTVRGHTLAWHSQLPTWVSSDGKKNDQNWSRAEALSILENHITNVVNHFKGNVVEWDVVNECLDDDQTTVRTNPDSYDLRQSVWTRAIGEDFIDSAFVYAHRADPNALLFLNDYGVELQGKAKSSAFYNLAMRLKRSGIPIDGVGLQCHFSVGDVDSVKLENTIRRFAAAGLRCIITELDMGIPSTSEKDLEEQARNYRVITDIVLNNDNCPYLVIWGVKDNDSWRDSSNPLLYTSGLSKKPAYYAVRSALRHRVIVKELSAVNEIQCSDDRVDVVYDLLGRRVKAQCLMPGIYIKGGKKIMICP
ncbi:MAG: endo-1,4-beta-xylanase [Prevotella sp.]|nr:endo-1,4-beta-xylanase [Prevotella sp.]